MLQVGSGLQRRFQIRVPEDDVTTRHWWYATYAAPEGRPAPRQAPADVPVYEVPWRDEQGGFLVDSVDGGDIMSWVTQGPVADRTRERLVSSDRGIVLLRKLLFEQLEAVERGEDPLGVVRDPARADELIVLPQERNKYRDGAGFLAESLELGHARHSPLREQILALLQPAPAGAPQHGSVPEPVRDAARGTCA
jgi:5,5'-dehydrodivanillate O-demethylase